MNIFKAVISPGMAVIKGYLKNKSLSLHLRIIAPPIALCGLDPDLIGGLTPGLVVLCVPAIKAHCCNTPDTRAFPE